LAQHRLYPAAPLRAVLELAAVYADDALRAAFASAVAHQTYTPQFVRGVLEHAPARAEPPHRLHVVLAPLPPTPGQRSLRVYQELLEGGRA
jgi:hypothetical protein